MMKIACVFAILLGFSASTCVAEDTITIETGVEEALTLDPEGLKLPRAFAVNSSGDLVLVGAFTQDPYTVVSALERTEPQQSELSKKLFEILDRGGKEWRNGSGVIVTIEPSTEVGECPPCSVYSRELRNAAEELSADVRWVRVVIVRR